MIATDGKPSTRKFCFTNKKYFKYYIRLPSSFVYKVVLALFPLTLTNFFSKTTYGRKDVS